MSVDEVLVIGAGPFGLSISAHLSALDINHRIVGRPFDTWRTHMPVGMRLKSEPYASEISAPKPGFDVASYCKQQDIAYNHRVEPLSVEGFTDYGDWFTKELVPGVTDITATGLEAVAGGFLVSFADADPVSARQVVVASGVLPFAAIPGELGSMPPDLVTHTAEHHHLDKFRGRKVAVIGAGQSALETAALLHESGAEVQLVVRRPVRAVGRPEPGDDQRPRLCQTPGHQALRRLALRVLEHTGRRSGCLPRQVQDHQGSGPCSGQLAHGG